MGTWETKKQHNVIRKSRKKNSSVPVCRNQGLNSKDGWRFHAVMIVHLVPQNNNRKRKTKCKRLMLSISVLHKIRGWPQEVPGLLALDGILYDVILLEYQPSAHHLFDDFPRFVCGRVWQPSGINQMLYRPAAGHTTSLFESQPNSLETLLHLLRIDPKQIKSAAFESESLDYQEEAE